MNTEEYHEYLKSENWRQKAQMRLSIDGHRCCMCGCTGTGRNPLQVHHITYKRISDEDILKDLLTLCRSCHRGVHQMMNRTVGYTEKDGIPVPVRGWKDTLSYSTVSTSVFDIDGTNSYIDL